METQELIASLALTQEAAVTYTDIDQAQDMLQINWDTRAVTIPKSVTNAGVKNDHLSKKLVFSMDRYVCGVDLANHTFAIHFINVDKWDSKKKNYDDCASGVYPVTNIDLSVDGKVTCEWEITNAATQVVGDVVFALHVFTIVDSAFTYHLGTTPTLLDLLDTVNAAGHGKNITPDEIEVYIQKMADLSAEIDAKVAAAEAAAERAEAAAANFEADDTLSQSGKAADAAVVGEKFSQLSSENAELKGDLKYVKTSNLLNHSKVLKDKRINVYISPTINNYTYDKAGSYVSPIIDVEPNKQYCFVKNNSIVALYNNIGLILFDQDGRYVTDQLTAVNNIYTIPENIYYIAFCTNSNNFNGYNFKEYKDNINLEYEEYGYRPKRIEDLEQGIEDLEQGIEDLGQEVNNIKNAIPKRKTIVLMNFDAPATFCEDGRYELVEKYNIPCTLNVKINGATSVSKPSKLKEMLYKGYDFATYGGYNAPAVSTINSEDESELLAWDTFVKNSKNAAETVGVFNPTAWFCTQGKTGTALNKALINNGYKIARGYIVDHPIDKGYLIRKENYNNRDPLKCNIEHAGLYPNTYETVLSQLDEAIEGGYDIAPLTHGIEPDEESANVNYGVTYKLLESFFQVLREKADNGEIELMTFREYYKTYYEADGQLNDYSRMLKTTEFFYNN